MSLRMNSVTLDWLDLIVILSTFASCAVVGWFAGYLMNRFELVKPMEPVAPIVDVQQIDVTVVNRGWRRWRKDSDRKLSLINHSVPLIILCHI